MMLYVSSNLQAASQPACSLPPPAGEDFSFADQVRPLRAAAPATTRFVFATATIPEQVYMDLEEVRGVGMDRGWCVGGPFLYVRAVCMDLEEERWATGRGRFGCACGQKLSKVDCKFSKARPLQAGLQAGHTS